MALITDPDNLNDGVELVVDPAAKTVRLVIGGNLTVEGCTGQALYSKLKELWRSNSTYIRYPFPMESITPEQFEFVQDWIPLNDTTRKLIRTAGWAERSAAGAIKREYCGVVSLGSMGATDQPYYQQVSATTACIDFTYAGPINEAIQIYGDLTNGDFTRRTYLNLYLREYSKTYASAGLSDIGVSSLTYIVYRFPLSDASDLKITHNDTTVSTTAPYTSVSATYVVGNKFTVWDSGTAYVADDVVSNGGRWWHCLQANTNQSPVVGTYWDRYQGERQVGASYYAFNVLIEGSHATCEQIYEKCQYMLRQNSDIDSGAGSVTGESAAALMTFVGDSLKTGTGVYVDDYALADTNRIAFKDVAAAEHSNPFMANGTLSFNPNLTSDPMAKYWMFFTTNPTGNFGTATAVLVQDDTLASISGNISGQASIPWTFNYDSNTQGGRTAGTPAAVTVVALGLSTGQYVQATATLTRATGQNIALTAGLERNYSNS